MTITRTHWIPPGFTAITLGNHILVRPGVKLTKYLLAHEIMHVYQWRRYGLAFPLLYVWGWMQAGFNYTNNKWEVEARHPNLAAARAAEHWLDWREP